MNAKTSKPATVNVDRLEMYVNPEAWFVRLACWGNHKQRCPRDLCSFFWALVFWAPMRALWLTLRYRIVSLGPIGVPIYVILPLIITEWAFPAYFGVNSIQEYRPADGSGLLETGLAVSWFVTGALKWVAVWAWLMCGTPEVIIRVFDALNELLSRRFANERIVQFVREHAIGVLVCTAACIYFLMLALLNLEHGPEAVRGTVIATGWLAAITVVAVICTVGFLLGLCWLLERRLWQLFVVRVKAWKAGHCALIYYHYSPSAKPDSDGEATTTA